MKKNLLSLFIVFSIFTLLVGCNEINLTSDPTNLETTVNLTTSNLTTNAPTTENFTTYEPTTIESTTNSTSNETTTVAPTTIEPTTIAPTTDDPTPTVILPVIYINTVDSTGINSDEEYTPCSVTLNYNQSIYDFTSLEAGIRLRGNSTQQYAKKPYRIKFAEDIQLLGLGQGASKSWLLLGEYVDYSMLRNKTAFDLANGLLTQTFVSDTEFVEVYVNGVYQGVYLLAEQTHINEYRVNIDESGAIDPSIVDTGYLIELECDQYRRDEEGAYMTGWFDIPGYSANQGEIGYWNYNEYTKSSLVSYYVIKSDTKSEEQVQYIQDYMLDVYNAIYVTQTEAAVSELINVESAVSMYILQLLSNDVDNNYSSTFLHKDKGGKLIFGPTWDHDLSFGNHLTDPATDSINMFHLLYDLGNLPWFNAYVLTKWNEINLENGILTQAISNIDSYTETYSTYFESNYELWQNTRETGGWHFYYQEGLTSQSDGAEHFKNWLHQRIIFINDYLNTIE